MSNKVFNTLFLKKKKRRMRILSACIFSKSFGGKITLFNQVLLTE